MTRSTQIQEARNALAEVMGRDDAVMVLGEDVALGGPFGLTKGLAEESGVSRVRNTPISEGAIMGAAIGVALGGGRPFVDLMFNDFVTAASDQLFNHAAKIHYMSGGRYSVPLTVWTVGGAGTRWGAQHSQRLDGWFAQVPGLKVLAPASPAMMRATVTAALDDPDPVVVLADRSLLFDTTPLPGDDGSPWEARKVSHGHRTTIVATGRLVHLALEAIEARHSADVIDLQRLAPLHLDPVLESLAGTSRLLVLHDEAGSGAMAASITSQIYAAGFWLLDAPIEQLTSPNTPVPAAASLEDAYRLDVHDVRSSIERLEAW